MPLYLGIDLGTTYFKAGIFDGDGNLRGLGRRAVQKDTEIANRCELPVNTFWSTLHYCIADAIHHAQADVSTIEGISYSSQANSFVLLDTDFKPLTPLILWPDKRGGTLAPQLTQLSAREDFFDKTGLGARLSNGFCLAKLVSIKRTTPSLWKQVKAVMTISDYLTYILTGERKGDLSTASLLGLLDIKAGKWWREAFEASAIDEELFSEPLPIGTPVGSLTEQGAKLIGLPQGIRFSVGGLDHHVAAIGAGVSKNNDISQSTGTVLACVNHVDYYQPQPDVFLASGIQDGHYFQMTHDENGARSLEWYQRKFAPEFTIAELIEQASSVAIGSDGLIARPCSSEYEGLAGFSNVRKSHQNGHFVRAILESTALTLSRIVKKLAGNNSSSRIITTGGGAQSKLWTTVKANMLNREFVIPENSETACLGAAMIAAVSNGQFGSIVEAGNSWVKQKAVIKPDPDKVADYQKWLNSSIKSRNSGEQTIIG